MKKWIAAATIAALLFGFGGCSPAIPEEEGFADSYIEGDLAEESVPAPEKEESSAPSQPEKKPASSEKENAEKGSAEENAQGATNPATSTQTSPETSGQKNPAASTPTPSQPTTTTPSQPIQDDRLPKVYPFFSNGSAYLFGMAKGENGTIATIGKTYISSEYCFVDVYDENMSIKNTRTLKDYTSLSEIISCSDGGFLVITHGPSAILKLDSNLKTEWAALYSKILAIQEFRPGNYALLTHYNNSDSLEIHLLDQTGKSFTTISLATMESPMEMDDAAIFSDSSGGFYLATTWTADFSSSWPTIQQAYDPSGGADCLITHFSSQGKLDRAFTVGGPSDEWCEEAAMDDAGNFYIALGTNDKNNPLFSAVPKSSINNFRRLLVKIGANGKMIYSAPLSGHAMAVDQVFGIEISGDQVFVAGFSGYDDGLQNTFPCAHNESGMYNYVNYVACIDSKGTVYDRRVFGTDINYQIAGSLLLPNGSLVVCGAIDKTMTPFNLSFPASCYVARALFVYPNLAS